MISDCCFHLAVFSRVHSLSNLRFLASLRMSDMASCLHQHPGAYLWYSPPNPNHTQHDRWPPGVLNNQAHRWVHHYHSITGLTGMCLEPWGHRNLHPSRDKIHQVHICPGASLMLKHSPNIPRDSLTSRSSDIHKLTHLYTLLNNRYRIHQALPQPLYKWMNVRSVLKASESCHGESSDSGSKVQQMGRWGRPLMIASATHPGYFYP